MQADPPKNFSDPILEKSLPDLIPPANLPMAPGDRSRKHQASQNHPHKGPPQLDQRGRDRPQSERDLNSGTKCSIYSHEKPQACETSKLNGTRRFTPDLRFVRERAKIQGLKSYGPEWVLRGCIGHVI